MDSSQRRGKQLHPGVGIDQNCPDLPHTGEQLAERKTFLTLKGKMRGNRPKTTFMEARREEDQRSQVVGLFVTTRDEFPKPLWNRL